MQGSQRAPQGGGVGNLGRLVRYAVALFTAGAGLVHLSAAQDHPAHPDIAAFFVAVALAQLGYAAWLAFRPRPGLLLAGVLGNAAVAAIWLASRTTGIPFYPAAQPVEAVAAKDAVATLFELLAIAGAGLLAVAPDAARRAVVPVFERAMVGLLAGTLALAVTGVLAPHGHGHDHGAHGHGPAHVLGSGHGAVSGPESAAHHHGAHEPVHAEAHAGEVVDHSVAHVPAPHAPHGPGAHTTASHAPAGGHHGAGSTGSTHDAAGHGSGDGGGHREHAGGPPAPEPVGTAARVTYGPFVIPPASASDLRHSNALLSNTILTRLPPPCTDCYLTHLAPDLVYADGSPANYDTGMMLHHQVTFDSSRDDPTCRRSNTGVGALGERVFASGNERSAVVFPEGFGLYVPASTWWSGIFEIMNHTEEEQVVYFTLSVHTLPGSEAVGPLTPIWLDLDNCGDSQVEVPAGRSVSTWDWESNLTGRIVAAGGHVHDWGVSTTLANDTTGEHVCRSVAGYGTMAAFQGHLETMSVCSWDRIGVVRAGDVLRISALYDTPEPLGDVMGIMMAFVYETDDLDGGTQAPRSVTHPPEGPPPEPPPDDHHH